MAETTIKRRRLEDGIINDAKVAAGASIATSKLADSANFIMRSGSVPFTGVPDIGGNRIANVGTATQNTDAVNLGQMNTAISSALSPFTSKGTVRVATTANITLSGTQTIDGVAVAANDRVLVKNQTTASQNGIYIVAAGAWTRSGDMDAWDEIPGAWVTVQQGTTQADTVWLGTADQGGTLGTTNVTFINPLTANLGLANSNFVDNETPSGTVNGSNTAFTLANTPVTGSVALYEDGILMEPGSGNDYTITGATITMTSAPVSGSKLRAFYRK